VPSPLSTSSTAFTRWAKGTKPVFNKKDARAKGAIRAYATEADREYMEREMVNWRQEAEMMKDVMDEKGSKWVPGSSQFDGGQ
jgi:hypothetical protein